MSTTHEFAPTDLDLGEAHVIEGTVTHDGLPVQGAYVRLVGRTGRVAAEVPTSGSGAFRFHAGPGPWTLLTFAPGATLEQPLDAVDLSVPLALAI